MKTNTQTQSRTSNKSYKDYYSERINKIETREYDIRNNKAQRIVIAGIIVFISLLGLISYYL